MERKSGGPRTPQGKARSSKNSTKHKISIGRILPEEKREADYLYREFSKDLLAQGPVESELIDDIVLNRLKKRRIDAYFSKEIDMARIHKVGTWCENRERIGARTWRRFTTILGQDKEDDHGRLAPKWCVELLSGLKTRIQERGPMPDDDLKLVELIYGEQLTEHGAELVCCFNSVKLGQNLSGENREAMKLELAKLPDQILKAIEIEIDLQKTHIEFEASLTRLDLAAEALDLPSGPNFDLYDKQASANTREFMHLLAALKQVRSLKREALTSMGAMAPELMKLEL